MAGRSVGAFAPTEEQLHIHDLFRTGKTLRVRAGAGTGKALRDDQPVLTLSGFKPIGSLHVGDKVIGANGQPTTVTGVYPQGVRSLFAVTISDGTEIIADAEHRWLTETTRDRQKHRNNWQVRTTAEIAGTLTISHGDRQRVNHYLPMLSAPVAGDVVDSPLDPWLIGLLIGDGGLTDRSVSLSNPEAGILDHVRQLLPAGTTLAPLTRNNLDGLNWRITTGRTKPGQRGGFNPVTRALTDMGLMGKHSYEKRIPEMMLHAAPPQRLALLQGLMDADGYAGRTETEFCTTSEALAEQVVWLVQSLGGTVATRLKTAPAYTHNGEKWVGRPAWRLFVKLPPDVNPFAYSTKADRHIPLSKYPPRRQIIDVHPVEDASATCISVSAADKLYVTAGCVLTHNTSTLIQLADIVQAENQLGLYLAFNKSIATEAGGKFPRCITASTSHSLAFKGVRNGPKARLLDKLGTKRIPPYLTARKLNIDGLAVAGSDGKSRYLDDRKVARHAIATVDRWCKSGDSEMTVWHVPRMKGLDGDGERTNNAQLADVILPYAHRIWADVLDPSGEAVAFGHGHYLKLWALSRPMLGRDGAVVFLDEAQDTAPVLAAVLDLQKHLRLVVVGDQAQAIYRFTGAQSYMTDKSDAIEGRLTRSWRFGQTIADAANVLLDRLGDDLRLSGNPARDSVLAPGHRCGAVLCRTNGTALEEVMKAQLAGKRVHLMADTAYAVRFCDAADKLKAGEDPSMEDLAAFGSWGQVQEYVEQAEDPEWNTLVSLIDEHGTESVREALAHTTSERNADIIVSTAHKSKGREFDSVRLAPDIAEFVKNAQERVEHAAKDPDPAAVIRSRNGLRDELMLAYVATTRAMHVLDPGELFSAATLA